MDPIYEMFTVAIWLVALKGFQIAVYPYLKRVFGNLAYPVAYPVGFIIFGIVSWYCGVAGLPVSLAVIPLVLLIAWSVLHKTLEFQDIARNTLYDIVFLLGFAFILETRFINPVITTFSEGFMDHAFIASIMRTGAVPPPDPWFAPEPLTMYYYYGHWLMGATGSILGLSSPVVYNLAIPTVFGMSFVTLYATGKLFSSRFAWLSVGAVFVITPAVVWAALMNMDSGLYGILDRARYVIPGTLVDYPLYSMWIGDAHANLMGIFNQALLIFLLSFALLRWKDLDRMGGILVVVLVGLSLGAVSLIHSWDIVIYGPLTVITGIVLLWRRYSGGMGGPSPFLMLAGAPVLAYILYLPYHCVFHVQGVTGIDFVHYPTPLVPFLLAAGFFVVFYIACSCRQVMKKPWYLLCAVPFVLAGYPAVALAVIPLVYLVDRRDWSMPWLLGIAGLTILVFVEFLHFKEALSGENERFNTVVKLYFSALFIMALSAALIIGRWCDQRPPVMGGRSRKVAAAGAAALILVTPVVLQVDIGRGLLGISYPGGYYTLDGSEYIAYIHPGDADAIRFLQSRHGNDRVVEAFGGDYSYYSRISSFTGIPTILGQLNAHEFGWRGDPDGWYWYRPDDIAAIYENPEKTLPIMEKYDMNLLYVGDAEREKYNISLPENGLDLIYDANGVQIYERVPDTQVQPGPVRAPAVIDTPGEYGLTRDIVVTSDSPCLDIRVSNVIINGNGHRIRAGPEIWGTGTGIAVYHPSERITNVTISDLHVEGFGTGLYGVHTEDVDLDGIDFVNNHDGAVFTFCNASAIRNTHIGGSVSGLALEGSDGSIVTGNRIEQNDVGLVLRDAVDSRVYNNVFSNTVNVVEEGVTVTAWNCTPSAGSNIAGGPIFGGNRWLVPGLFKVSPGCTDTDADGFCDLPIQVTNRSTDFYALSGGRIL